MEQGRRGSVITVFSTASAVGKTLVAINMAAELARLGHKVCLVDVDLQFAKNAGLTSVGCGWGYRGEAFLKEAGAAHVISHPLELLDIIDTL